MTPETRQRIRIASVIGDRVLASPWMRRLASISFLGTLDAHPGCRRRSTRWDHSLAVAERGVAVARVLELDPARTRTFVAACLLHDVGHYPFSHAAEPAFARVFGHGHHGVGEWIVRGTGPVPPARSLRPTLADEGIEADEVWAVIDGVHDDVRLAELSALLRAPINLDTLDGIARVVRDFGLRGVGGVEPRFVWRDDEIGVDEGALADLDGFWSLKNRVYTEVIDTPANILAEARLCDLVVAHVPASALEQLPELDDAWLLARLGHAAKAARPDLRDDRRWQLASEPAAAATLIRLRRRYFVDPRTGPIAGGLPRHAWARRYRHERGPAYLISRGRQLALPGFAQLESPEL